MAVSRSPSLWVFSPVARRARGRAQGTPGGNGQPVLLGLDEDTVHYWSVSEDLSSKGLYSGSASSQLGRVSSLLPLLSSPLPPTGIFDESDCHRALTSGTVALPWHWCPQGNQEVGSGLT